MSWPCMNEFFLSNDGGIDCHGTRLRNETPVDKPRRSVPSPWSHGLNPTEWRNRKIMDSGDDSNAEVALGNVPCKWRFFLRKSRYSGSWLVVRSAPLRRYRVVPLQLLPATIEGSASWFKCTRTSTSTCMMDVTSATLTSLCSSARLSKVENMGC